MSRTDNYTNDLDYVMSKGKRRGFVSNQLSDNQKFRLWQFLREQDASIQVERPTIYDVAERAAERLGFRVTEGNIQGAIEADILKRWEPSLPTTGPIATAFRRLSHLERWQEDTSERLDRIEAALRLFDQNLTRLYRDLGMLDASGHTVAPAKPSPQTTPAAPT
jgi:hypothetical protein